MGRKCWGAALVLGLCLALAPVARGELRDIDTRHYRLHTDLDDALALNLGQLLDNMYDEYAQRLAVLGSGSPMIPRLEVYLFKTQKEYLKFSHGRLKNTGG